MARIAKGLSQQELADKIQKTRPLISHIEQTGKVNHTTLVKISKALGVSIDGIQNLVNEPTSSYTAQEQAYRELVKEKERLLEENAMLKELVQSQKEVISMLKKEAVSSAKKK